MKLHSTEAVGQDFKQIHRCCFYVHQKWDVRDISAGYNTGHTFFSSDTCEQNVNVKFHEYKVTYTITQIFSF